VKKEFVDAIPTPTTEIDRPELRRPGPEQLFSAVEVGKVDARSSEDQ
jgi:hypothetical protein